MLIIILIINIIIIIIISIIIIIILLLLLSLFLLRPLFIARLADAQSGCVPEDCEFNAWSSGVLGLGLGVFGGLGF